SVFMSIVGWPVGRSIGRVGLRSSVLLGCRALRFSARQISNVKRLFQREVQPRLRRNLHLLALGEYLDSGPGAAAHRRSDGRACAAAGNSANERAQGRASSYFYRAVLAPRTAGLLHVRARHVVGLALENDALQVDAQFALARKLSGGLGVFQF